MNLNATACPVSGHSTPPANALRDHVVSDVFPCVGAKAALSRGNMEIMELGRLGNHRNDARLLDRLVRFARAHEDAADSEGQALHTFAAIFSGPRDTDEHRF